VSGFRTVREVDERLRDGPGGDQLRAHPRHVADLALPAPGNELGDELVKLCRAQDPYRASRGTQGRGSRAASRQITTDVCERCPGRAGRRPDPSDARGEEL
jgi:hypothetical protein